MMDLYYRIDDLLFYISSAAKEGPLRQAYLSLPSNSSFNIYDINYPDFKIIPFEQDTNGTLISIYCLLA